MIRTIVIGLGVLILSACEASDRPTREATPETPAAKTQTVADYFDCVRESGGVVLSAHRGGPVGRYPENAIETFERTLEMATPLLEVDVVESRDGVLYLMHDSSLGRTTTGSGSVADTDWQDVATLRLRDKRRRTTEYRVPTLAEALDWAKANNAILQLDKKPQTSFRRIIAAVREAGAENNVLLIIYRKEDVQRVHELAPDLVLSASVYDTRDLLDIDRMGVDLRQVVAFTGIRDPDPSLWRALSRADVEPIFGTLGRRGERLDDVYAADGDLSEFQQMADQGLVVIATDLSHDVAAAIDADDVARATCPR